jgi:uncharacterized membrane protein
MGKLEYLDALKRAMVGLAPEIQAKTLAYYEQRFVDGVAAGRSEEDISKDAGDPGKIAMTLRASTHLNAFEQKKNPANLLRLFVSVLGLAIFNLFMVVPALVYSALLATLYACALAFYVAGIAITASGLSGANELVLDGPLRHFVINDDDADNMQTKVSIGDNGIHVYQEKRPREHANPAATTAQAGAAGDADADSEADADTEDEAQAGNSSRVIRRAEAVAGHGIHITTDLDSESRTTQTVLGLGMVVAGIVLFLLSLVVSRYTLIGIRRYIAMNLSLLKGN